MPVIASVFSSFLLTFFFVGNIIGKNELDNERVHSGTVEKKPAPEDGAEAETLQVPSTSGVSSGAEGNSPEDFQREGEVQETKVRTKNLY